MVFLSVLVEDHTDSDVSWDTVGNTPSDCASKVRGFGQLWIARYFVSPASASGRYRDYQVAGKD